MFTDINEVNNQQQNNTRDLQHPIINSSKQLILLYHN